MRRIAAVVLVDARGRLLLQERDGQAPVDPDRWSMVGGGVEDGEDVRAAALREAWEETGLRLELPAGAPEVFVQRRRWSYAGVVYDQTDHFFTASVPTGTAIAAAAATEMEKQTVLGERWWSVAELQAATTERFEPPELADLVISLRDGAGA